METAPGDAANQRHPGAFEHAGGRPTGQLALAFVTTAGGFTAPEPMPRPIRKRLVCLWIERCTSLIFIAKIPSQALHLLWVRKLFSAFKVAFTTLIGFVEP